MQSEKLNNLLKYGGIAVVFGLVLSTVNLYRNYSALKEAYDSQPLVMVMQWDDLVNDSNFVSHEEQKKAMQLTQEYLHKLENRGAVIIDGRYVNAVSDDFLINYKKIRKITEK